MSTARLQSERKKLRKLIHDDAVENARKIRQLEHSVSVARQEVKLPAGLQNRIIEECIRKIVDNQMQIVRRYVKPWELGSFDTFVDMICAGYTEGVVVRIRERIFANVRRSLGNDGEYIMTVTIPEQSMSRAITDIDILDEKFEPMRFRIEPGGTLYPPTVNMAHDLPAISPGATPADAVVTTLDYREMPEGVDNPDKDC